MASAGSLSIPRVSHDGQIKMTSTVERRTIARGHNTEFYPGTSPLVAASDRERAAAAVEESAGRTHAS